jgi:hypothetical protein
VSENHKKLKELYAKLNSRATTACPDRLHGLTQSQFVDLFVSRERIYLLAIADVNDRDTLINTDSSIAKFEVLSTRDALRVIKEGDSFKISLI